MKIIRTLLSPLPQKTIITIGNFDALHQGHQYLLDHLIEKSKKQKLMSLVMTFEPLPSEFFSTHPPARLSSFKEKCLYLKKWNLDYLICLRFNKALANLSSVDFVKTILIEKLNMKHLIIGEGFRFAYQRQGDSALLQQLSGLYDFTVDMSRMAKNAVATWASPRPTFICIEKSCLWKGYTSLKFMALIHRLYPALPISDIALALITSQNLC